MGCHRHRHSHHPTTITKRGWKLLIFNFKSIKFWVFVFLKLISFRCQHNVMPCHTMWRYRVVTPSSKSSSYSTGCDFKINLLPAQPSHPSRTHHIAEHYMYIYAMLKICYFSDVLIELKFILYMNLYF